MKKSQPPIRLSDLVLQALTRANLVEQFKERPYAQQKSYLAWINGVKGERTRLNRLAEMLRELKEGSYDLPSLKTKRPR